MDSLRQLGIRDQARALLIQLWRKREEIWGSKREVWQMVPVPTDVIVRSILGLDLQEPESIPSDKTGYEIAGYIERHARKIVVAQKFRPEYRRFTMAHEIAHWVMHPDVLYHRESAAEWSRASQLPAAKRGTGC